MNKISKNRIFMSIVLFCDILFNTILMFIWFLALNSVIRIDNMQNTATNVNGGVYNAFGGEMGVASCLILALCSLIFTALGLYLYIMLMKRCKSKTNTLKTLLFKRCSGKYEWINTLAITILFMWNIVYGLVVFYVTIYPLISSAVYGLPISTGVTAVYLFISMLALSFAILNMIYYISLLSQLHEKLFNRKVIKTVSTSIVFGYTALLSIVLIVMQIYALSLADNFVWQSLLAIIAGIISLALAIPLLMFVIKHFLKDKRKLTEEQCITLSLSYCKNRVSYLVVSIMSYLATLAINIGAIFSSASSLVSMANNGGGYISR